MKKEHFGVRVVRASPLLVAALLFTFVTGAPLVLPIVGGAVALAWLTGSELDLGGIAQAITLFAIAVLGALMGDALLDGAAGVGPGQLATAWATIAMVALFVVSGRRFFARPLGGPNLDFALMTLAVAACGERRGGPVYVAGVVAFVMSNFVATRARDASAPLRAVEGNGKRVLFGMAVVGVAFVLVSRWSLPRLEDLVQHRIATALFAPVLSKTGFTDRLHLGSTVDPILESDEMVLRVYGPPVDYLRGQVYDHYEGGSWASTGRRKEVRVRTRTGRPDGEVTEVRTVGNASQREERPHYFLPLGAHDVGTAHGVGLAEPAGTLRPIAEEPASPLYFSRGEPDFPVAPPTAEDLIVPPDLAPALQEVVSLWTKPGSTDRQKVADIEAHLRSGYTYSLEPNRLERGNEHYITHFLFHSKRGHCEYFATAMALLGRQAGVPMRVVGGYRVAEHNPVGGYDIVREKNAHAWAEAFVPGLGWRTVDATPSSEGSDAHETRGLSAFTDAVASAWERLGDIVARASIWQILGALVLAVGALLGVRWVRQRRSGSPGAEDDGHPLASFGRLEAELARRGIGRSRSEPLEHYADRLASPSAREGRGAAGMTDDRLEEAAVLVRAYGAFRYGGVGREADVAARIEAYVGALSSRR